MAQDAKDNKTPDFIVDMKEPASCKDVPATDSTLGLQPAATELDATYSTFTKVPAANGRDASAQIELSGGFLQLAKKTPPHKPSPAHRAGEHRLACFPGSGPRGIGASGPRLQLPPANTAAGSALRQPLFLVSPPRPAAEPPATGSNSAADTRSADPSAPPGTADASSHSGTS